MYNKNQDHWHITTLANGKEERFHTNDWDQIVKILGQFISADFVTIRKLSRRNKCQNFQEINL